MKTIFKPTKYSVIVFGMSSWDDLLKFNTRSKNVVLELEKRSDIDKILHLDLYNVTEVSDLPDAEFPHIIKQYSSKLYVLRFTEPLPLLAGSKELPAQKFCHLLRKFCDQLQFSNIVLWLYNPLSVVCFGRMNELARVFDGVDNWLGHKTFIEQLGGSRIGHGYAEIQKRADVIFVVAERLLELFPNRKNVKVLENAVDVSLLQRIAAGCQEAPPDIRQVPHPIVGFSGGIQHRIDFELLRFLAERNPGVSFVFVGPVWHEVAQKVHDLEAMSNVHFLGQKDYSVLPCYLKYFDVCIIPHVHNELEKSGGYSMKALDYLALGRPVISSTSVGIDDLGDFVSLVVSHEAFDRKLKEILNHGPISVGIPGFLRDRTWENTVDKMMREVTSKITWARVARVSVRRFNEFLVSATIWILRFPYRVFRRAIRLLKAWFSVI